MSKTKHTEGKIKVTISSLNEPTNVIVDKDGRKIATATINCRPGWQKENEIVSNNEGVANAARLVKCWNMHDELIRKIKLFIELQEEVLVFIDKEQFQTVKAFIDSSKELIKQSEQ